MDRRPERLRRRYLRSSAFCFRISRSSVRLMARSDELLISRSMIFRSVRALRAPLACPLSDLDGLCIPELCVSTEAMDPLLNTRGRRPGSGSDAIVLASIFGSDGDMISGLGRRPSF